MIMDSLNKPKAPRSSIFEGVRYEHLAGGVAGGLLSTLVLHPLDLLKVRFAVPDTGGVATVATAGGATIQRQQYRSLGGAMAHILKNEGLAGFYKGVTPNLVGAGASWGFYFLFYNVFKTQFKKASPGAEKLTHGKHMLAAAQSGVGVLLLCNPIWVVKTRLCLQSQAVTKGSTNTMTYTGMCDALGKIARSEGLRGLYKGTIPGLLNVSHGTIQFVAYEELKARCNTYYMREPNTKQSTSEYLFCAAVSKLFAATITYPCQVIRARMQDHRAEYKSLRHCVEYTWSTYGARGLYRGLFPNLLRVVPATAITFVVYETLTQHLLGHPSGASGPSVVPSVAPIVKPSVAPSNEDER